MDVKRVFPALSMQWLLTGQGPMEVASPAAGESPLRRKLIDLHRRIEELKGLPIDNNKDAGEVAEAALPIISDLLHHRLTIDAVIQDAQVTILEKLNFGTYGDK